MPHLLLQQLLLQNLETKMTTRVGRLELEQQGHFLDLNVSSPFLFLIIWFDSLQFNDQAP